MKKPIAGIIIITMVLATSGVSFAAQAPPSNQLQAKAPPQTEGKPQAEAPSSSTKKEHPFQLLPITPHQSDMEDCFNDPMPTDLYSKPKGEI